MYNFRKISLFIGLTIFAFGLIEIIARSLYYQLHFRGNPVAIYGFLENGFNSAMRAIARNRYESVKLDENKLYTPPGAELLAELKGRYKADFVKFSEFLRSQGVPLLVIYIPSDDYLQEAFRRDDSARFFKQLTEFTNDHYFNFTKEFVELDPEVVTLMPFNGHLSRYGHQIVARALAKWVSAHPIESSSLRFDVRPKQLGDLDRNSAEIWNVDVTMPYRVITNSQGFRREEDLEFPKLQMRILMLGDSFTFGPYCANHDTYPEILERLLAGVEVVNAGVSGYTIEDEASLYFDRAQYAEPDLVILQVLDNDITDYLSSKRNHFSRKRQYYQPSVQEAKFKDRLFLTK